MKQPISQHDGAAFIDAAKHTAADHIDSGLAAMSAEAEALKAMASQSATKVANTVSQGIKSASEEADIILDTAKDKATALQKLIADELRVHPWRSLGIAVAIGLVAGYVNRR